MSRLGEVGFPSVLLWVILGLVVGRSGRGASFVVSTLADAGAGSLRQAIVDANAEPGPDRIECGVPGRITLGSPLPSVSGDLTVVGPGLDGLRIDANGRGRIFSFEPGTTNQLSGLTLSGGRLDDGTPGAAILNAGTLEMSDCAVADNRNIGGLGGGIYSSGDLVLLRCRISGNLVVGGAGQAGGLGGGGGGGGGLGGGVFLAKGSVLVSNSVFEGNRAVGGAGGAGQVGPGPGGNGGGPSGGRGGASGVDGEAGGLGGGGGGGGYSTGVGGEGGLGGGGGGGGTSSLIRPHPGDSVFGGGSGGEAMFESGFGFGGGGGGGAGLGGGLFMAEGRLLAVGSRWVSNRTEGGGVSGGYWGRGAGGGYGGALFANGGAIELRDCLVADNHARGSDGQAPTPPWEAEVSSRGGGAGGGGVCVRHAITVLSGSTVARNEVHGGRTPAWYLAPAPGGGAIGGGVSLWGGLARITNCTFSGNGVFGGQGGYVGGGTSGGSAWGGALGAISNVVTIVNVTVTGNRAVGGATAPEYPFPEFPPGPPGESRGGGFQQAGGLLRLLNTLVSGNIAATESFPSDGDGFIESLGFNLLGSAAGIVGVAETDLIGVDPHLGPLEQGDGPTPVHALLDGSPALDAGIFDGAPGSDQRGVPRPVGSRVDLGAYEQRGPNQSLAWILVDGVPAGGGNLLHAGPAEVSIASSVLGGVIRYTLDGSDPSSGATAYAGPFRLTHSALVRAVVFGSAGGVPVEAAAIRVTVLPDTVFSLAIERTGDGAVAVDPPSPTGFYRAGSVVQLRATPAPTWNFGGWSGDASGSRWFEEVAMTTNRVVRAEFTPTPRFPLAVTVEGLGRVTLDPPVGPYLAHTPVRVTAGDIPGPGGAGYWSFAGWSGDLQGSGSSQVLLMDRPRVVTARFARTDWGSPRYWVVATTEGGGRILEPSRPPDPGAYPRDTVATLTAVPDPGWEFLQWVGDLTETNLTVSFRVDRDVRLVAVFGTVLRLRTDSPGGVVPRLEVAPVLTRYPYGTRVSITVLPPAGTFLAGWRGLGSHGWVTPAEFLVTEPGSEMYFTVSPLPNGWRTLGTLALGGGRVQATPPPGVHPPGHPVTLVPVPDEGQVFLGWSGDATGTASPLQFTLDESRNVIATFTRRPRLTWADAFGYGQGDSLRLELQGRPGTRYTIESSTDLRAWQSRAVVTPWRERELLGIPPTATEVTVFFRAAEAGGEAP